MSIAAPAPAPYGFETSGKPGGNGDYNLYVTDATGRKIAAVWGKRGEKDATAAMFIAAPDMLSALKAMRIYVETLEGVLDPTIDPGAPTIREHGAMLRAAIAKAEGRAP